MKNLLLILLALCSFSGYAQTKNQSFTRVELEADLVFLNEILQSKSSYQELNGYRYKDEFHKFLKNAKGVSITKHDFELFLSKTIGKIGDRHASISGDRFRDDNVIALAHRAD